VTYLREGLAPLERIYDLTPESRRTIAAVDDPELVNTSFGMTVTFDRRGVAERAMYFGTDPVFKGGHESAGVTETSTTWFLAEGATGAGFDTFILVSNPGTEPAEVTFTFLPQSGEPATITHTVAAASRLTINPEAEDLAIPEGPVATQITSTKPVIAERAQYWPFGPSEWTEAHNSFGSTQRRRARALLERERRGLGRGHERHGHAAALTRLHASEILSGEGSYEGGGVPMWSHSRSFRLALPGLAAAALALSVMSAYAEDRPPQKVKVFAFAQREVSGFVDPQTQDLAMTVKDIRDAVIKKKNTWLELVEAPEQADIILEVTDRRLVERDPTQATTTTTYSKDGKTASSTTTSTKEHDVVLKAVMRVGDYSNELTGVCDLGYLFGGPYRKAAQDLVGSLEKWVKANYTRLQLKKLR
jgi:hypothetical protein